MFFFLLELNQTR